MTSREAFKFGFLCRCVEEGLTPAATQARIDQAHEKRAFDWAAIGKALGGFANAGKSTLELAGQGFPVAAMTGVAGGAGIGAILANLNRSELDEDEIRRQELIDTYNLFADRALEKSKAHQPALG